MMSTDNLWCDIITHTHMDHHRAPPPSQTSFPFNTAHQPPWCPDVSRLVLTLHSNSKNRKNKRFGGKGGWAQQHILQPHGQELSLSLTPTLFSLHLHLFSFPWVLKPKPQKTREFKCSSETLDLFQTSVSPQTQKQYHIIISPNTGTSQSKMTSY